MIALDVSNAELVILRRDDPSDKVEVVVGFTDCPDVILKVNVTDTILITDEKLTISTTLCNPEL